MNNRKNFKKLNGNLNVSGTRIKIVRENQEISRQQLSNKLMIIGIDISAQSIFDIETGTRTVTDYELKAIGKILNVSVDFLLQDLNFYF